MVMRALCVALVLLSSCVSVALGRGASPLVLVYDEARARPTKVDIYNFPTIGPTQTQWKDASAGNRPDSCLFYLGAGNSGVVRELWFTGDYNSEDPNGVEIRIYVGQGDVANFSSPSWASSAYLMARIPLGPFLGTLYGAAGSNVPRETAILDFSQAADATAFTVGLKLPIPFENGILIQMWRWQTNVNVDVLVGGALNPYSWCSYETGSSSSKFQHWRLRSAPIYRKRVAATDTATTIFTTASAGQLVGVYSSVKDSANAGTAAYIEGNWRFYADGAATTDAPTWETSGYEDLFGMNAFGFANGENVKWTWGCTDTSSTSARFQSEAYRLFTQTPVRWTKSATMTLQNPSAAAYRIDAAILYYTIPEGIKP